MNKFIVKVCCWAVFVGSAIFGGWTGQLIAQKRYPLSVIDRVNLTPEVKPGTALELAQYVDRQKQCDIEVKRTITTASGQRIFIKQIFEEGFGPLGGDKYVLPVNTPEIATFGPARMYSKGYSWCSWIDYVAGPSESEPWILEFAFAERTRVAKRPAVFDGIGVKAPQTAPPPETHQPQISPSSGP